MNNNNNNSVSMTGYLSIIFETEFLHWNKYILNNVTNLLVIFMIKVGKSGRLAKILRGKHWFPYSNNEKYDLSFRTIGVHICACVACVRMAG